MDSKGVPQVIDARLIAVSIQAVNPGLPANPPEALSECIYAYLPVSLSYEQVGTTMHGNRSPGHILLQYPLEIRADRNVARPIGARASNFDETFGSFHIRPLNENRFPYRNARPIEKEKKRTQRLFIGSPLRVESLGYDVQERPNILLRENEWDKCLPHCRSGRWQIKLMHHTAIGPVF